MNLSTINNNYQISLVDKKNWTRITISVRDKENNYYPLNEVTENLVKYLRIEMEKDESALLKQIYPAMSQLMFPALSALFNEQTAQVLINGELIKTAILDSMVFSFLFLKYIQQKELKIVSESEPLMQGEIDLIKNREEDLKQSAPLTQLLGISPQDLLKTLYNSGEISNNDIKEILSSKNANS